MRQRWQIIKAKSEELYISKRPHDANENKRKSTQPIKYTVCLGRVQKKTAEEGKKKWN